jgi:predicted ribosomally synthesized peptide with nif11-like leader
MSVKTVLAFIHKVNEDEHLYMAVKRLNTIDISSLMQVATDAGYSFSLDDWKDAVSHIIGELNDSDLDQVVGGAVPMLSQQVQVSPVLKGFLLPYTPASPKCLSNMATCGPSCAGGG